MLRLVYPSDDQLLSWEDLLTAGAAELTRTAGYLTAVDDYDLSTSLAGFFLDGEGAATLNLLETYRSTALWYWLYLSPDSPAGVDSSAGLHKAFLLNRVVQPSRTYQKMQTSFDSRSGSPRLDLSEERARFSWREYVAELTNELVILASHYREYPSPIAPPASVESFTDALAVHPRPCP